VKRPSAWELSVESQAVKRRLGGWCETAAIWELTVESQAVKRRLGNRFEVVASLVVQSAESCILHRRL
jgi:hypothetical protein